MVVEWCKQCGAGVLGVVRSGPWFLAWMVIYVEMFWHSVISAMIATFSPLLPAVGWKASWRRFGTVSRCCFALPRHVR